MKRQQAQANASINTRANGLECLPQLNTRCKQTGSRGTLLLVAHFPRMFEELRACLGHAPHNLLEDGVPRGGLHGFDGSARQLECLWAVFSVLHKQCGQCLQACLHLAANGSKHVNNVELNEIATLRLALLALRKAAGITLPTWSLP